MHEFERPVVASRDEESSFGNGFMHGPPLQAGQDPFMS